MKKIDEKELHSIFSEFKNRNQSAYNLLYEKYYKLVYSIAFSVLKNKDDSEDIANEVFTKIYKLDKEKLPVSNEASWLFTVTRNECFTYLRKSRVNISIDEIYDVPSDSKEIQEIVDSEYYNKLISGLSEQEKTIVSLKVLSGFTFSKISQVMNIPIGTVQWKYYKAISALKVSVGGLAGAIVAFMLVVLRQRKVIDEKPYLGNKQTDKEVDASQSMNSENVDSEIQENASTSEMASESATSSNSERADKSTSINDSSNAMENVSESALQNKGEKMKNNSETFTSIEQATATAETVKAKGKFDTVSLTGITVGIAFLIIFIIFFKKYQQKLGKKKSKE